MSGNIKAVIFDFGGVLAEEGFREGLIAIARKNGLDPEPFRKRADDLIHESGYVTGKSSESYFWSVLREQTGITGTDQELRTEILARFVLRPPMIESAKNLRSAGFITAILSDQTDWLEELDQSMRFLEYFQCVFNSYRLGKSKRDPSIFSDVCAAIGTDPAESLFIDDNIENIKRAAGEGLCVLHFRDMQSFQNEIAKMGYPVLNSCFSSSFGSSAGLK